MRRKERRNRNRSLVVLLVLCAMFASAVAGCNKPVAENPEPSTPTSEVESEVVSEEVSEPVSEEPSEEVISEEVSEEVIEQVEIINCANFDELLAYLEDFNKTTIVVYNFSDRVDQVVIPNGEKCEMDSLDIIGVFPYKEVVDVQAKVDYITVMKPFAGSTDWSILVKSTGTDIEVSFTVNYADGTSEDFTVYVTIE